MPTRDILATFWNDYDRLTPEQQTLFKAAVRHFLDDLRARQTFRPGLRVKRVQRVKGVYEMTWAPDGRATFAFGTEVLPGEPHIIWRRIGGHDIFTNP
ncbi:MAG: hypothetical protein ACRDHP_11415 [Ktedonobacterales bacterium]